MLARLTITDHFTIINYQAREYSRDATTGQWTLDGGRCLVFLFWKTHHIFFESLMVDTRQTEINMTFSLLTLRQIIAWHFFSTSNLKPWVQKRESPPPARKSANTTKSGVSKTSRWRSIEKGKQERNRKKYHIPKKGEEIYEKWKFGFK